MRSRFSLAVLLFLATGCTTWRPQPGPAPEVVAANRAGSVRVWRRDQSTLVLRNPTITSDSIVGQGSSGHAAVALADVQSIDTRRTNVLSTALLTAGIALVVAVVALANGVGVLTDD
jgi:acetyl-CoA carboxylase alpha subunit